MSRDALAQRIVLQAAIPGIGQPQSHSGTKEHEEVQEKLLVSLLS
jgi:hypothetical protein